MTWMVGQLQSVSSWAPPPPPLTAKQTDAMNAVKLVLARDGYITSKSLWRELGGNRNAGTHYLTLARDLLGLVSDGRELGPTKHAPVPLWRRLEIALQVHRSTPKATSARALPRLRSI